MSESSIEKDCNSEQERFELQERLYAVDANPIITEVLSYFSYEAEEHIHNLERVEILSDGEKIDWPEYIIDLQECSSIIKELRYMTRESVRYGICFYKFEKLLKVIDTPESDLMIGGLVLKKMIEVMKVGEDEICLLREYYEASDSSMIDIFNVKIAAVEAEWENFRAKRLAPEQEEKMQQMITVITQDSDETKESIEEYLQGCDDEVEVSFRVYLTVLQREWGEAVMKQREKMQAVEEKIVERSSKK
ncbi:hypothetical protein K8R20_01635 [bacterium]|nr:hypothetical protein [bacterium]